MRKIYVFYADVFLLQNLCMDYLAVLGSNLLLKRRKRGIRLWLMAAAASATGLFLVLFVDNLLWYQLLTHFVLNTGMVLGCFGLKSKREFLENWVVTYFMVLFLGGGMEWLCEQRILSHNRMMQMLTAGTLLFAVVAYLMEYRSFGSHIFPGYLQKDGRKIEVRAYYDSGNQLRDPYTGKAVNILSDKKAQELLEGEKAAVRLVPYRSLGEQNGLLRVTDVEVLEMIQGSSRLVVKNAVVGIAEEGLFEGKEYNLILHAALLDGAKQTKSKRKRK